MRLTRRHEGRHAVDTAPDGAQSEATPDAPDERTRRVTALSDLTDACQLAGVRVHWGPWAAGATRHVQASVAGAAPVEVRVDYVNGMWSYVWHGGTSDGRTIGPTDDLPSVVATLQDVLRQRVM